MMADEPERKDVTIGVPPASAGADPVGEDGEEDEDGGDGE